MCDASASIGGGEEVFRLLEAFEPDESARDGGERRRVLRLLLFVVGDERAEDLPRRLLLPRRFEHLGAAQVAFEPRLGSAAACRIARRALELFDGFAVTAGRRQRLGQFMTHAAGRWFLLKEEARGRLSFRVTPGLKLRAQQKPLRRRVRRV